MLRVLESFELQVVEYGFWDMANVTALARHSGITVYDAVYVLTAFNLQCDLITADEKLFEKVRGTGFVKLL